MTLSPTQIQILQSMQRSLKGPNAAEALAGLSWARSFIEGRNVALETMEDTKAFVKDTLETYIDKALTSGEVPSLFAPASTPSSATRTELFHQRENRNQFLKELILQFSLGLMTGNKESSLDAGVAISTIRTYTEGLGKDHPEKNDVLDDITWAAEQTGDSELVNRTVTAIAALKVNVNGQRN